MFKSKIKIFILSIISAFTFAFPSLSNAQRSQYIVTPSTLPSTYFFQPTDFEVGFGIYASSSLPIQYASSDPSVATIVDNKIRAVSVGTFVLTLSQPGNAEYNPAASLSFTVTLIKGPQTLTFPDLPTKGLTDLDFSPGAFSSSGLPVSYTSSNPSVATIVGGQVRIVGTGSTEIRAIQDGNANYSAATSIARTLSVSENTQTIDFPAITKIFTDPVFSPLASSSSGLAITYFTSSDPSVATIQPGGKTIKIVGTGTSTITAFQAGTASLQAASASTLLTVGKGNQTITMMPQLAVGYLSPDFTPVAVVSSHLPLSFTSSDASVATIVAGKIHITGTGSTTITASQAGDVNYNPAADVTQNLVVAKATQSITFPIIPTKALTSPNFDPGAVASSGLPITYTSTNLAVATIVAGNIQIVGLGATTIIASQAGNGNFEQANSTSRELTVSGQTQVITFPAIIGKTFGAADFNPGATSSSGLLITYTSSNTAVATIVANQVHIVGAGSTQITATQLGNESFASATAEATLIVNKEVQSINFTSLPTKLRSDSDYDLPAAATSNLPVTYLSSNPAVAIVIGSKLRFVGAGTSVITAEQAGNNNFEPAAPVSRNLTVNKGQQVVIFPNIPEKLLTDVDFDPSATTNSGLPIVLDSSNPAVATIVSGKIHIIGVGTSTITATQLGDANYEPASATSVLKVVSFSQTITFPDIPVKTVASPDFSPGATASSGLTVAYTSSNTSVATIVGGMIHIVGPGNVQITASQAGNASYKAAESVEKLLRVTGNSTQTITFPTLSPKPFDAADFDPGAVSSAGLQLTYSSSNPAVATVVDNKIHIVGVGSTIITANQLGNNTYGSATASSPFDVIKATPSVIFSAVPAKTVNDVDFFLSATTSSGLPITFTSSDPTIASIIPPNKVHLLQAGTVVLTATVVGNANYNGATATQSLSIGRGSQTITFPDIPSKLLTSPDFNPGATVNSSLPITYTSSNTAVATIVSNQIHIVGLGTTVITASQAGNASFDAAANVSKIFRVGSTSQTITMASTFYKTIGQDDFEPGAVASSGLGITYSSDNSAVATIVDNKVHIVGAGTAVITATQLGNDTFAGEIATAVLTVAKGNQTITLDVPIITKFRNDPDYDPGAIASSGLPITYLSTDPSVAIIVANKVRIVGIGVTNIVATQLGNADFNFATAVEQVLTVVRGFQVITFPDIPGKSLSSPDFDPGANSSALLPITYTSSNLDVATIVNGKVHIVGNGTSTITASQIGNSQYSPAADVSKTLTVNGATQIITFAPIPNKKITDPDFDPGATVNTNLPIIYSSSNASVATIVNNKVHIVGPGITTIIASQSGNQTYAPASASVNLTVELIQQTIALPAIPNKKLTDVDFDPGATVSTGLPLAYTSSNLAVATIVANKVHIVGAGTTTITATQAGNATYAPVTASVLLTVDGTAQTITFPAITAKDLTSVDFDPGATASSGLAVTYSSSDPTVATIVANKVHIVGVGTTTITAMQGGNSTFAAATPVALQMTVNKANQTITFPAIALKTPTDADFDLNATSSSGLTVSYSSSNPAVATIVAGKVHIVGSGTSVITASQLGNATYNAAADVSQTLNVVYTLPVSNFTVKATDETCKSSNNGSININAVQALNYTAAITINGTTTTYPFSTVLAVNNLQAGTYTISISVAGQPNYSQPFTVTIKEPKDLAVYSSIKNDGNSVLLKLEGSDQYKIEINGQVINTTAQEISLPLIKGNNIVKISSTLTCQGVITKTFLTTNSISLYPNPVKNTLNISTGLSESNAVRVDIHGLDGRLVHTSQHRAEYGQVAVDLSKLNKGLYVLTLTIGNSKTVHKIIKD